VTSFTVLGGRTPARRFSVTQFTDKKGSCRKDGAVLFPLLTMLFPTRISIGILVLALFGSIAETHAAPLHEGSRRAVERSVSGPERIGERPLSKRSMRQAAIERERSYFEEQLEDSAGSRLSERQLQRALERY